MEAVLNLPYADDNNKVDEYKICLYKKDMFDWVLPPLNSSYIIKHRRTLFGIPLWWHKIYYIRRVEDVQYVKEDYVYKIYSCLKDAEEELKKLEAGFPPIYKMVYQYGELLYIQRKKRKWNAIFFR